MAVTAAAGDPGQAGGRRSVAALRGRLREGRGGAAAPERRARRRGTWEERSLCGDLFPQRPAQRALRKTLLAPSKSLFVAAVVSRGFILTFFLIIIILFIYFTECMQLPFVQKEAGSVAVPGANRR